MYHFEESIKTQDLKFRKRLIYSEIRKLEDEFAKNQEFIRLFNKQNEGIIKKIKDSLSEAEEISIKIDEIELKNLIKQNL